MFFLLIFVLIFAPQLVSLSTLQSEDDKYMKTMRSHLLPFLQRCDLQDASQSEKLIHDYMVDLAQEGLDQCLLVFQNSKSEVNDTF